MISQYGNEFYLEDRTPTHHKKLPVGTYLLKLGMGYYLEKIEDFKLPSKVYGDLSIVDRWLKSFENTTKNMGILLSGVKGGGKTITAQHLCLKSNLPVILITEPFSDLGFTSFITNPSLGKGIVFIDEFEKTYREKDDEQKALLSLMDGNYNTNLIYLLTVNETNINPYLINRLGRIKYRKHYQNLEDSVVEDVINDMLKYPQHKESIYEFFDILGLCTFDILVNIIKEINMFNESAIECGKHLNVEIESTTYDCFEIYEGNQYLCLAYYADFSNPESSIDITRTGNYFEKPVPKAATGKGKNKILAMEEGDVKRNDPNGRYFDFYLYECEVKKINRRSYLVKYQNLEFLFKPQDKYKTNRLPFNK